MKKYLFLLLVFGFSSQIFSQDQFNHRKNNIFLEAFGNAGGYSLNYDRIIFMDFSVRAGAMILNSGSETVRAFPILLNKKFYTGESYFEVGVGATVFSAPLDLGIVSNHDIDDSILTGVIGYCAQSNIGFNIKFCFTPFYFDKKIIPFGGFSLGYSF